MAELSTMNWDPQVKAAPIVTKRRESLWRISVSMGKYLWTRGEEEGEE